MERLTPRRLRAATILVGAVLSWGCASTGGVPRPFPQPNAPAPVELAPPNPVAEAGVANRLALVETALNLRGVPYRNGGDDRTGFDCSGFTQYVFSRHGMALPRDVLAQSTIGRSVRLDRIQPGDLIFFSTVASGASHVAISLGRDAFVHAPSASGVVRVEHLRSRYWMSRFIGIRRVLAD